MCFRDRQCAHESGNIFGQEFGGVSAFRFVSFTGPAKVERDAGKVLGVLGHLKGVTGVIGGQVRNENQGLAGSLLLIVYGDAVRSDLRHRSSSWTVVFG